MSNKLDLIDNYINDNIDDIILYTESLIDIELTYNYYEIIEKYDDMLLIEFAHLIDNESSYCLFNSDANLLFHSLSLDNIQEYISSNGYGIDDKKVTILNEISNEIEKQNNYDIKHILENKIMNNLYNIINFVENKYNIDIDELSLNITKIKNNKIGIEFYNKFGNIKYESICLYDKDIMKIGPVSQNGTLVERK